MRQRYSVVQRTAAWTVWDNQRGQQISVHESRRKARAECQRLNASEVQAREMETENNQQSREETI